jgi:RimJ/RimL family protein N-acetyltransferase
MMYVGEKVRLRAYRKEDLELRLSYINDTEVVEGLVPDTPYPMTFHEEEKWFESISALKDTYKFAIETIEDMKFIGGCSINAVDWKNRVATVGIFIGDKTYWGKGYGRDAMRVLLSFIFMEMNMNKARLTTYSYNLRAIKSYEKCGFMTEGVLRQEIYRGGNYFDKISMGILKDEFVSKSSDVV